MTKGGGITGAGSHDHRCVSLPEKAPFSKEVIEYLFFCFGVESTHHVIQDHDGLPGVHSSGEGLVDALVDPIPLG